MEALNCPKCGAPLQVGMIVCPYCRVGLVGDSPQVDQPALDLPAEIPSGWVGYHDPWHGFTLAHPPGWSVVTYQGQISVREDPAGCVAAWLSPFTLPAPASARQVAGQFIALARWVNPSFQAWGQVDAAKDSPRLTLRTRQQKWGQVLEGVYNIVVEGPNAIISGYQAPEQVLADRSVTLTQILTTFRTAELMPRQLVHEPMEGAFTIQVPAGWGWQAGVNRQNIGGAAKMQFATWSGEQGLISASMPWYTWNFVEGMGGIFGAMFSGRVASMPYMLASQFCQGQITQMMAKSQANLRVESAVERPDLAEQGYIEMAQAGYIPQQWDISTAILETTYDEAGTRLRQKARVSTLRQRGTGMWTASNDLLYRASDAEFSKWEPVLSGILDSLQVNPAWKQAEQRLAQNYIANAQADIHRRQQEISRTLSETSDIITNSYWNRQATYDRLSEQRSNATLGYQNMTDPSGDEYKVPAGFDRYWRDGLGNIYGGSWLTNPDINWQPLEPTGI